jgi:outer membrane usher protein
VRLDEDRIISFNGEPFYPLAALSPVQEAFDAAALPLELALPPALFDATALQPGRVTTIEPRAARGGFVDYDVLYLAGDRVRSRLDGLFELGVFDPIGVLIGSFRTGDLVGDGREIVRLHTTFIKDMPPRRATLRFGDSLTAGGTLGRPVRFGGIQLASNFATDPSFQHRHRRVVGVQSRACSDVPGDGHGQRLEQERRLADPVGQRLLQRERERTQGFRIRRQGDGC